MADNDHCFAEEEEWEEEEEGGGTLTRLEVELATMKAEDVNVHSEAIERVTMHVEDVNRNALTEHERMAFHDFDCPGLPLPKTLLDVIQFVSAAENLEEVGTNRELWNSPALLLPTSKLLWGPCRQTRASLAILAARSDKEAASRLETLLSCGHGAMLDQTDTLHRSAFVYSCVRGYLSCARAIAEFVRIKEGEEVGEPFKAPNEFCFGDRTKHTLLCEMMMEGAVDNAEDVVEYLLSFESLNREQGFSSSVTPFQFASERNLSKMMRLLLIGGVDVVSRAGPFMQTPLISACAQVNASTTRMLENLDVIRLLLAHRNSSPRVVNLTDARGWSAFHYAAYNNSLGAVEMLLESKAKLNLLSSGEDVNVCTPLSLAMRHGNLRIVSFLLTQPGIDVNCGDSRNAEVLLLYACQRPDAVSLAELLFDTSAEINVNARDLVGDSPLHHAAAQNCLEMCQLLLAKGADCNITNDHGDTPLMIAAVRGNHLVVRLLVAQPSIKINAFSRNQTTALTFSVTKGHLEVVLALLQHPRCGINKLDKNGHSPLFHACSSGNSAIVEALSQHPYIDINSGDKFNGTTSLHRACELGHLDCVQILTRHPSIQLNKASVYNGMTALSFASKGGHSKIVVFLLQQGIEAGHTADNHGNTALRYARKKDIKQQLRIEKPW